MGKVVRFTGNAGRTRPQGDARNDNGSLVDRLAAVLSEILDDPLVTLADADRPRSSHTAQHPGLELRLANFKPDLAERAAELLEEAGW